MKDRVTLIGFSYLNSISEQGGKKRKKISREVAVTVLKAENNAVLLVQCRSIKPREPALREFKLSNLPTSQTKKYQRERLQYLRVLVYSFIWTL